MSTRQLSLSSPLLARALAVVCAFCALAVLPSTASAAPKKVQLRFSATGYSVSENAGTFNVTVLRTGNTRAAASVQYSDNGTGTATGGGVNYSFTGGTLNFAAGETSKTFPVTIVDNGTTNPPNKTIVFRLSNATPGGSQIKTTTSTLTIIDDEGPGTLDFSSSTYTVLEGAGLATVTVNRIGASNLALSVNYATQAAFTNPASAIFDYTAISPAQTLTFNPGQMSKTFQIAIADDSNAEGPENVGLVLSSPINLSGGAAPQLGPNGPAQLTINDDDVSTFSFSAPAYVVQEDALSGHATITVNRGGATNIPASVNYATSNGTALADSDYTAAAGTLNFAAGETTKTFNVDVANDGASEANETVTLTLASGATTVATSLLSIVDNDNAKTSIQLSSPVYNVNEADGTANVTVTLSHAVDADVTIDYATTDGLALAGSDYTDTNGTLTFSGNLSNGGTGQTSKTIQIPVTQDPDPEDPETLTLTLSNAQSSASAVLGAPATGTITIDDDDPAGQIDFKSLHYNVNESAGQATVTVQRAGGVGGAVSVDYATSDGTATAGSDYAAASGTLNWAAGDGADKSFTVPVTWDGRAEGPEAVNLTLSNPGGGSDLGPNSVAVVNIGDDGASGPLVLTSTSYSVGESDSVVTITVTRSGGSLGGPVTVDYATSADSATAGSDYTDTSGTLSFGPGEDSKSFTVPVTSDSADEGNEAFQVTLSNAGGGASLGSPAGATVTITDDDAPPPPPPPGDGGTGGTPSGGTPSGGSPSGGTTPPPAVPTLTFKLSARKLQRFTKRTRALVLSGTCDGDCAVKLSGKISLSKARSSSLSRRQAAAKRLKLRAATYRLTAGKKTRLRLKVSKRTAKQLLAGLKQRRRVTVTLTGAATGTNTAQSSIRVRIRLKR